ncbi:flagellar biosynthesis protein FlhF [Paraburkholderia bannensis]|uniref:Flagellar biosynthesis protein FlhF n=1 Tax=Paraburkholderia bannensis TaxID=765414 RepID=A0A7W9WR49_9BURK|nr:MULTISPECIES: flagellar biosynthesis protein FlhF [Paraburkholderia]MBB3255842.1 flagellar biosynthesis protein FlhF [Paraburkholderia sp. WP4_3_2]MBB6100842.1 flagellar biosynthesis protein FlhF [Paraburkholderia bannensis]
MNIRKFIGGNSRDALRLVREALGADAVVLSNRTLDDGTVEIVALADSDLAAIAPADAARLGAAQPQSSSPSQALATRMQRAALPGAASPMSAPATAASPAASAAAASFGNPYASGGMPDVFSSVFGASPEVGVEPGAAGADSRSGAYGNDRDDGNDGNDSDDDHADDLGVSLAQSLQPKPAKPVNAPASRAAAGQAAQQSTMPPTSQTMAASPFGTFPANGAANRPASTSSAAREAAALLEQAVAQPFGEPASAPRTMAETNPWLIDHARRIASQQNQQNQQESAKVPGMSPSAAMARGLGMTADPVHPADIEASQPQWALEAAHAAARRAARSIGQSADAAGPAPSEQAAAAAAANTAQTVSEAIRSRIEQVVNETVMNELASMRGMMEEQFAGLLWGERQRRSPVQGALTKQLFAAGFSAQLVKMMIERLPDVETEEAGMEWVQSVLESNLPVLEDEEALMERGGVFALMGPTGVGKTTTTAKLAARCVMRFGASKVALLTTDSYRIGGHEQLRIFGKILGVSVHAVRDGADLELALTELKSKHIVLIDTIGMSQRDRAVADQIGMLCGTGRPVQRLLLLSATNHGDTLNEVVQAYQSGPDESPLTGCILTKLDEATNLGSTLDTVLRYKLPVHYVSTGQKVPENLYVATRRFLIRSAFCVPRDRSPFVPHEDDIPALLSALSNRSNSQAHEVRFG